MNRWLWICPILSVMLSVTVLLYWGWSWPAGVIILLIMICPAIMIRGALQMRKMHDNKFVPEVKNNAGERP